MAQLSNEQLLFNQRLLAEHCIKEDRALAIWNQICPDEDIKENMAQINSQMLRVGLEIRGLSIKGCRYYAFVNTFPDETAQSAIQMTAQDQAYVRAVLQQLVEDGETTKATLLNLRDKILTLPAAEVILDKLIDEKWIEWSDPRKRNANASKISLAPRTFMELSYMLVDDFGLDKTELPQVIIHRE
jgi:hypothetical protein